MVFKQVKQESPATKQLILNHTHMELAEDRDPIAYDNGIPDQIIFRSLSNRKQSISFNVEAIMVIGRKRSMRDSQVNIDLSELDAAELGVSHYHAMMLAFDNHLYIKDLDSLNGMRLNGRRMRPSKEYGIRDGDILAFGNLEVKIGFA